MSSKFALLRRLGISRGWCLRLHNGTSFYAVSIMHCLFIYLVLRAKAFRAGFWVVSYFIAFFFKKYVIHAFFFKIPGISKKRIFNSAFAVKMLIKRKFPKVLAIAPCRLKIGPTRRMFRRMGRYAVFNRQLQLSVGDLAPSWRRAQRLLNFWWAYYKACPINRFSRRYNHSGKSRFINLPLLLKFV